jgi:hypothetical protein
MYMVQSASFKDPTSFGLVQGHDYTIKGNFAFFELNLQGLVQLLSLGLADHSTT